MPNASKPSGEKGIGSLEDLFYRTRWSLTLIYVAILAVILLLSTSLTYSAFSGRIERRFAAFHPYDPTFVMQGHQLPSPNDVRTDLFVSFLLVNGALLFIAGILSYWLAGVTLEPIQEAYERQRRFLSDASHELRTPLAIMQTGMENELSQQPAPEARRRIESHLEEVQRMGKLVSQLLTLSKLDERQAPKTRAQVDVNEVVSQAVERLQPLTQSHACSMKSELAKESLPVFADKELLLQAITNVVKNAIQYNKPNGTVTVRTRQEANQIYIEVTDTGIGIASKDLDHLFDRFYRADKSRSRQTGGSGLGLSIVRSIVEQFGGQVTLTSKEGEGTTVVIRLPQHQAS